MLDASSRLPPPPQRGPVPPRPDAPSQRRRRLRAVALALVIALAAPGVLGLVAVIPWPDGDSDHSFLDRRAGGPPYRWEPCEAIHYEVNLDHAPIAAMRDVAEAVARTSEGSGIRFVFDGGTERTPSEQRQGSFHELSSFAYRPVLVAWLPADEFELYADPDEAIGIGIGVPGVGEEYWIYKSGLVIINADAPLPPGFGSGYALGPVLMHELGHVLGLGHVSDAGEIMWSPDARGSDPRQFSSATDWGDGDLEGLEKVGRPAGCIGDLAI